MQSARGGGGGWKHLGVIDSLPPAAHHLVVEPLARLSAPPTSERGTRKTVKARFWPQLLGKSPETFSSCCRFKKLANFVWTWLSLRRAWWLSGGEQSVFPISLGL